MTSRRQPPSIQWRLLAASLIILPLFLGLTALILDRAFSNYQQESQRESMRLQQLLLAKAANFDGNSWSFEGLDEIRFNLLRSGLYAFVLSPDLEVLWSSASAELIDELNNPLQAIKAMATDSALSQARIGESRFEECRLQQLYFCHSTRVAWGSSGPESLFLIMESRERVLVARDNYRRYLILLSLAATLLLLAAQSLIVRLGLTPLRRIAGAIEQVERGEADQLSEPYPEELVPMTDNLNVLLASEKRRRERVRNTMDRLTHVLKTPLMLMRNSTAGEIEFRALVQEQVSRMLGIVEGELAKARLDGRAADILGKPIGVSPVLIRIIEAYRKLPRTGVDHGVQSAVDICAEDIDEQAIFHGEERDLQDLFGSILENSLKYCRNRIVVSAHSEQESDHPGLTLTIGDDGDGIPEGLQSTVLERGARADSVHIGQGLGLSIVVEIVSAYGGSLTIERAALGGALFIIHIPSSPADKTR